MNYVDGFLCAVSNTNKDAYTEHAKKVGGLFKEYGALTVVDCWGDDVPEGKLTSFTMAVKRESEESVVFSWITWPSKAVRDEAWKKFIAKFLRLRNHLKAAVDHALAVERRVTGCLHALIFHEFFPCFIAHGL